MYNVSSEHSIRSCYGNNDFEDLEKTFLIDVPQPPRGVLRERCSENMQQN